MHPGSLTMMQHLLMRSQLTGIFSFMHSPLLVLLGGVSKRFKQTGQRESWYYTIRYLTSQSWYFKLLQMLVNHPLLISKRERLLTLPGCNQLHLLWEKTEPVSSSFMWQLYKDRGFSEKATSIILQSWHQSSQKFPEAV